MTRVLFTWYRANAGGKESTLWTWMPQVPAAGETVHIPLAGEDGDPENSIALRVRQVAWTCDQTPFWHAEVHLG